MAETKLSPAAEALRTKVEGYLRQKKLSYEVKPNGSYGVRYGSTMVMIIVGDWNQRTLVRLLAAVALQVTEISPELTRFLIEENNKLLFGKFSLDAKAKAVWYEHALLGDSLDVEELYTAIGTIVTTADQYDEQVCKLSGGKRVADV